MSKAKTSGKAAETSRRLNVRGLVILTIFVLVIVPGFFALKTFQGRASQSTYLNEAKKALDADRVDLALRYVNDYLQRNPTNLEALELKSKILVGLARDGSAIEEAIRVQNQILAQAPDRKDARKRLIELNLKGRLYRPAQVAAEEYLKRGSDDADAHRLMAEALEGVGFLGDAPALERAIEEYEISERMKPGDILGAERLAYLYRAKGNDPRKAQQVMDSMLKYNPASAPARLARFRFFLSGPDPQAQLPRALAEIDDAIKIAPDDLEARLVAAELAAQKGDPAAARAHLAAISPSPKNDLRIKLVTSMIELQEQKTDDAIQSMRSGLIQTGGSDADLTWRLARLLLEMGRVREAEPLMAQYRRLVGGTEPRPEYRYLVALTYMRLGRANEAVAELEAIRDKVDKNLAGQHLLSLGRAYEMIRDETKALDAYQRASTLSGTGSQPWMAIARIQLLDRPSEAINTLERGLVAAPNDRRLLAMLAQVLWQQEISKPKDRRDWTEYARWLDRAEKAAPNSPEVTLVKADYLASTGRLEDGLKLLQDASTKSPTTAGLWLARANALGQLGRIDDALDVLSTASKACGEHASLRTLRARLLLQRGEAKSARAVLIEGLDRVSIDERPAIWKALGEFYQSQTDFVAARRAYSEWARLQPDAAEPRLALFNIGVATDDLAAMDAECDALKAIGGATSLYWKIARVELLLQQTSKPRDGRAAEDKTKIEEAAALVKDIKNLVPRQPAGHVLEARLMERRNRPDDAIAAYQTALELRGGQVALRPLVVLLSKEGRTEELDELRKNVANFPPDLDRLAGALTLQMGNADKAEQMAQRMLQGDPQSLDAAVWKARVLNSLGKPKEAEETLRILIQQRPEDPSPWLQLLMFQISQREIPAARATVESMKKRVKTDRPELLWANCYRALGVQNLADEAFQAALQRSPDDLKVLQSAADYYETTGRAEVGGNRLRHMLKLAPENDWARRRLALNLSARSNDPAAWNEALTLVGEDAKGAESPDDRLLRATVLSRSPEPRYRNQAIEVLESLVAEIPTSARLHEVLARSYLMLGNRVKARDHAAKAAGQDASADAILFHASLALDDKDVAEAEKQLIRLIAIDPNAMPTVELNARIFHAKKNDAEAVALLERAYDVHRNSPDIQVVGPGILQVLIILEQFEAADKIGKQVAQIGPKGQIAYAQFLAGRGRNKEARELLDSAFKAGAMADAVRSALALAAGNPDSRADWLDQTDSLLSLAIKGQPDSIELLQAQAYLRHLQRKYNEEINTYLSILSKNPVNFLFLNNMAWTLSEELGRPQDGLDRINEALKKVGWQAHLADTRGVILLRLGKADDAVKDLEAAVQILPTPTIQYHLALAYRKAGKTAEFETYRTLAKSNGIKLDQLQPSEREAAAKILDIAPTASKPPPSNPAAASKS